MALHEGNSTDEDIEGLKRLVDTIHQGGAKAIAQLNHAGSAAPSDVTGEKAVAPSSVILPVSPMIGDGTAPEELTVSQIAEIVEQFACAAKRAKAAGYDGVEIHSAHAYLLNQFYSPLTNHREDDYGGDIERRLRIHREIIQSVRSAVGKEFMLSLHPLRERRSRSIKSSCGVAPLYSVARFSRTTEYISFHSRLVCFM